MTTTATRTAKGFKVLCPFCGDSEATVKMDLNDLRSCSCTSCDEEFSPMDALEKARAAMAAWERVVRFVEMGRELAAE